MSDKPRVTVYIPSHNYARYLPEAVESVFRQIYDSWELLLLDDGSEDDSAALMHDYAAQRPDRVRVFVNGPAKGLPATANMALNAARGEYIIRLDADDFFDESALLVMATYLDQHPEVGLVYPNYYYVNANGELLGVESRKRVGEEVDLLDLPAHGAGTMVRKRYLKALGGYNEAYDRQDGWDLWLRFTNRYRVANVGTALFFYRQHGESLTKDNARLLATRGKIQRDTVQRLQGDLEPRVVALIPAKNTYRGLPNIVLRETAGRPLIDWAIEAAHAAPHVDRVVVATDDPAVIAHVEAAYPGVTALLREPALSEPGARLAQVVHYAVRTLEDTHDYYPDIVVLLSVHAPLRGPQHISAAVDALMLHPVDSVISVYEDYELHYIHARQGLVSANPGMHNHIRLEREALYVDNGAVRALWADALTPEDMLGKRIGHVVMPASTRFQIKSEDDYWLVEKQLQRLAPSLFEQDPPHPTQNETQKKG